MKIVQDYPNYAVDEAGNVHNLKTKTLAIVSIVAGYASVWLRNESGGRSHKVHRLVARAYIDNPENKPEVNHLNSDKLDNRVSNLEWCTRRENIEHARLSRV